jgi:arsenate reductase
LAEYTILHNPRCSKSRQTLAILEQHTKDIEVFLYLEKDLTTKFIKNILKVLKLDARDILRKNEQDFKHNNLSNKDLSEDDLISAMLNYPKIIERPIVIKGSQGIIGRPPENVLELF